MNPNSMKLFASVALLVLSLALASCGSASIGVSAISSVDTTPPSVPAGLVAMVMGPNRIDLAWEASTDANGSGVAGYTVFRDGVQVTLVAATSYSDSGLSPSTLYSYTVAAYDGAGNTSPQSATVSATTEAPDTTAPSVPVGLVATVKGLEHIDLAWFASMDAGGSGVAGYTVFRDGVQVTLATATSYSDSGLSPSTLYSYTVAAFDGTGNTSAQSAAVSATTNAPIASSMNAPIGLVALTNGPGKIELHWDQPTDPGSEPVIGYYVYRDGTQLGFDGVTHYVDSGLSRSAT